MIAAGSMAALAIDAFGQIRWKDRRWVSRVCPRFDRGIPIVAGHALVWDRTTEVVLVGAVITRAHGPVPTLFRVPTDRELFELAVRGTAQKRSCMVARTNDIVNGLFYNAGFFTIPSDLVSTLPPLCVMLRDGV